MKIKLILAVFMAICFAKSSFALDVSGKIVNIYTSKGQKNIKISITSVPSPEESFDAVTGPEGNFIVSGLKNNTEYIIKSESTKNSIVYPRSSRIKIDKTDIKDFNFAYYPKYSVTGKISGDVKTKGLTVIFKSGSPFYDTASSTIDENGRYKVNGLIYGQDYNIFVNSDFYPFGILGDNSITITENNVKDMEIAAVFYGTGMVFDAETQKGLRDITVTAISTDGLYEQKTDTSADGSFILNGLYYGENYIIKIDTHPGFEIPSEIKTGTVRSTVTGLNIPVITK